MMRGLVLMCGVLFLNLSWAQNPKPVVQTWQALKFKEVVKQGLDYSCGSASMATILAYYFGDTISEAALTMDMTARLTDEELDSRIKDGFSLLDMRNTLVRLGYQAVGVNLSLAQAKQLKGPVVILLRKEDINHFVVLKGFVNDVAHIADPTLGNVTYFESELLQHWRGEALAIGKAGFELSDAVALKVTPGSYSPSQEAARYWIRQTD